MKVLHKKRLGVSIFIVLAILIYGYNEWLNSRVIVKNETIEIEGLPEAFDGYKILHFADLHGERFGKQQEQLVNVIKGLDYDLVAITGDMVDRHNPTLQPFFELIDGIRDERPILFSQGNIDDDNDFKAIREYGLEVMDTPYIVERQGQRLVFQKYDFYQPVPEEYRGDVVIGLGHVPFSNDLGYKLLLFGHYHGGQVRIPGYGALIVPTADGIEWVKDQTQIIGVQTFENYAQHITGGLGASAKFKWMQKRWFNAPEISVLTLKMK